MVLGIGVLLLVALVASAFLSTLNTFFTDLLPGMAFLLQFVNFLISLAIITLLFGLVFKVLPDVKIAWSDIWPGAALTAVLFMVGQLVLGWYLGRQSGASVYGAAGSLIVLLLWLYYSAQIFLFGAEFTQVYATRYGQGVQPDKDAIGRDQVATTKPASKAASEGTAQRPSQGSQKSAASSSSMPLTRIETQTRTSSTVALTNLSLGELVTGVVEDWRTLVRKEIQLAWAETQEALAKAARGAAMMAGGGVVLYAGLIVLLIAVSLILATIMPLWLAMLLIGLLVGLEGWIMVRWGLRKFKQVKPMPQQTLDTLREDVNVVKEHLAS